MPACRTFQRVITERNKNCGPPLVETTINAVFLFWNCMVKAGVGFAVPCIESAIANHFKMFLRNMANQLFNEIDGREGFLDIFAIFMAVAVESDRISIIGINPGSSNHRPVKIAADVFYHSPGIAEIRFRIDIETMFVFAVTGRFDFFKRRAKDRFHFIEECSPESIAEIGVVKVMHMPPESIIAIAAFRDETMDVWIPLEVPAKSMQDHDKTGSKISGFIQQEKHPGNHTVYRMKKTVEERTVPKEKVPEVFVNGKDTMAVPDINEFKRHAGRTFHGIFIAAGRTEAAVAPERNKLKIATMRTAIHGTPKRRVATGKHLIDVLHLGFSGMESIFNFFIIVGKNSL